MGEWRAVLAPSRSPSDERLLVTLTAGASRARRLGVVGLASLGVVAASLALPGTPTALAATVAPLQAEGRWPKGRSR